MWHFSFNKGHPMMQRFNIEAGSVSTPTMFSNFGQLLILNCWREVRWRRPLQSNISKLENVSRVRDLREACNKPSFGKDLTASHGPSIVTSVSMSIDGQDRPLSSFAQFVIQIDLNLGGIPLSGKDPISGQFSSRKYSNFGRRIFI
jgi:hypothetical protein